MTMLCGRHGRERFQVSSAQGGPQSPTPSTASRFLVCTTSPQDSTVYYGRFQVPGPSAGRGKAKLKGQSISFSPDLRTQENSRLHTCAGDLPRKSSPSWRRSQHITYLYRQSDYEGTRSDHPKPRAQREVTEKSWQGALHVLSAPQQSLHRPPGNSPCAKASCTSPPTPLSESCGPWVGVEPADVERTGMGIGRPPPWVGDVCGDPAA